MHTYVRGFIKKKKRSARRLRRHRRRRCYCRYRRRLVVVVSREQRFSRVSSSRAPGGTVCSSISRDPVRVLGSWPCQLDGHRWRCELWSIDRELERRLAGRRARGLSVHLGERRETSALSTDVATLTDNHG